MKTKQQILISVALLTTSLLCAIGGELASNFSGLQFWFIMFSIFSALGGFGTTVATIVKVWE